MGRVERQKLKSLVVVLFVEVSFQRSFKGTGRLNVTHVRINPFTAGACKMSGLKDARTRLRTVYFPVL